MLIFRSIRPEAKSVRHYLAREMRKTLQITFLKFEHFKELKTVEIPKPRNYHNWVFQNFLKGWLCIRSSTENTSEGKRVNS